MDITEHKVGAVVVVRPAGALVATGAERLRNRVQTPATEEMGRVVVDMEAVAFLDSRGIEALLDAADVLARTGMTPRVCGTTATVIEALHLTGAAESLEFHPDSNSAVRSFL